MIMSGIMAVGAEGTPYKFLAVGKSSENRVQKLLSKSAKFDTKTAVLEKFMGKVKILSKYKLYFWSPNSCG